VTIAARSAEPAAILLTTGYFHLSGRVNMRFKSKRVSGYQIFAVTGTNTVSFAIDASGANVDGLLGFAVERIDRTENERYFVYGYKVFPSVIRRPDETTTVKTYDHPIQSFVWDDFTAKDDREYEYLFYPLRGTPKNIDRSSAPVPIKVRTEPLFSGGEHDIFFNRGVASSQAYAREFHNTAPDEIEDPHERERALEWLSRKLDDAILAFIGNAKRGDTLLGCFYEFHYAPVVEAFREAITRGVNVRLIVDGKVNERTDKNGFHESFPREANRRALRAARIPRANYVLREAKPSDIAHNKFIVLLRGQQQRPVEVWTGSTNVSKGGFHGQTNVGHWVRSTELAASFKAYWDLLEADPGPAAGSDRATSVRENKVFRASVEALGDVPTEPREVPNGITPIFSPRTGTSVLDMYAKMVDEASSLACITLAFGIGPAFKAVLDDNTPANHVTFMLLEREDKPNPRSDKPFVRLNASHNVYKAWGSFLRDSLYQWTKETNAERLELNMHVSYVHSKFLLMDPLGADPIVVTGSANFSNASTTDNDENMLIIRGNRRVADIYLTEFNRLFFHYYFRSVQEATLRRGPSSRTSTEQTLFLDETDGWTAKYTPGSLKRKRVELLTAMHGAVVLS
jgi:phosphatidylserine/phosphatidylglycerophosphate/cardiolipin synthase-like enzyme